MSDKKTKAIEEILKKLFELLEAPAEFEIGKDKDNYLVKIKTQEGGILIGSHGNTLQSFKHFLSLSLFKKFNEWVPVVVDINEYWGKREKELCQMAEKVAERVATTGEPAALSFLIPAERRIVHLALASHPKVFSESEGEGRERKVVIKPRP